MVISENASLGWHRDKHNLLGSSNWAVPLGLFLGGEIRVLLEGQTQEEAEKKVAGSRVSFFARRKHCVREFQGDKIVLVGYTPRGIGRMTREDLQTPNRPQTPTSKRLPNLLLQRENGGIINRHPKDCTPCV